MYLSKPYTYRDRKYLQWLEESDYYTPRYEYVKWLESRLAELESRLAEAEVQLAEVGAEKKKWMLKLADEEDETVRLGHIIEELMRNTKRGKNNA